MIRRSIALVALAAAAVLIAAGCGSDDEQSGEAATATTPATVAESAPSDTTRSTATRTASEPARVRVVLGKPDEFSLVVTPRRIPAGPVVFTVVNQGTVEHELVILRTIALAADLDPEDIVHGEERGRVNEHPEHQQPGATQVIRANLKPGHFSMICNVPGHYQAGQLADFVVT